LLAAGLVLVGGLSLPYWLGDAARGPTGPPAATFIGSETCTGCHRAEAELWHQSQHKRAMDHATDKSVLGDFSDAIFDYYGVRSRFFRKDGKFFVETDGSDGKFATFEVKYTFGVEPLQQYLIEFPDGRLQALSIAWDSRPRQKGGQRWFHLYPNENVTHDDVLHWTKLNQNWNFMCAECHSTGVRKNYDAAHDRFATTWSEISVGCETCHGRGSLHLAWARDQRSWRLFAKRPDPTKGLVVRFDERAGVTWSPNPVTGRPQRNTVPALLRREVETCGLCHARRSAFSENWVPGTWLSDTHHVSPLDARVYHADGQMRDGEESYNYGPFRQSKMFAVGVTCSDCHDPHSASLRAPGDGVCAQCHAPDKYATAAHNHHGGVTPQLACPSCHMPARTYMVIDRRHDHSFRVPRPDLSLRFGTPNACNDCHQDKSAEWSAAKVEDWFGPQRQGYQTYAQAYHAAWSGQPDAEGQLAAIAAGRDNPAYVRASALGELSTHLSQATIPLARAGLADRDPMVRIGALDMLESVPPTQLWPMVAPLLSDAVQGVRIRAAALLAAVPTASQPQADRERFERAASEFVTAQGLNADRPEARTSLANFLTRRGRLAEAEAEYRAALRLNRQFAPAAVNLADLYRLLGRDKEGEGVLRAAIASLPRDAELHHALGLTLTRLKRAEEALDELRQASELAPERARYAYVYAVALHSAGQHDAAMTVLRATLDRHPSDRDSLLAIIGFSRDAGDLATALQYAEQLQRVRGEPGVTGLIETLRRQIKRTDAQ
jgi:predicted CXXCH cytochrome family protein